MFVLLRLRGLAADGAWPLQVVSTVPADMKASSNVVA
jgi:hypothetical protein